MIKKLILTSVIISILLFPSAAKAATVTNNYVQSGYNSPSSTEDITFLSGVVGIQNLIPLRNAPNTAFNPNLDAGIDIVTPDSSATEVGKITFPSLNCDPDTVVELTMSNYQVSFIGSNVEVDTTQIGAGYVLTDISDSSILQADDGGFVNDVLTLSGYTLNTTVGDLSNLVFYTGTQVFYLDGNLNEYQLSFQFATPTFTLTYDDATCVEETTTTVRPEATTTTTSVVTTTTATKQTGGKLPATGFTNFTFNLLQISLMLILTGFVINRRARVRKLKS